MLSQDTEEDDDIFTLDDNPQLDDALIMRLTYDLATKLHKPEVIARRYGLSGREQLKLYLRGHPKIVADAKKLHAMFSSDAAAEDRVRTKFLHATEELIIPMAGLVADPHTPLAARIDGFKQLQRGAGLDGINAKAAAKDGPGGQPFNLSIVFSSHETMSIAGTTVVDATEIPDLPTPNFVPTPLWEASDEPEVDEPGDETEENI